MAKVAQKPSAEKKAPSAKDARVVGRGGHGRGQGRKQTAITTLSRVRSHEIATSGCAPLDVLMDNMIFWHKHALAMGEKLQAMVESGLMKSDSDEREKAMKLLGSLLEARDQSERCAVDAAPYVHPRLSSVAFKGSMRHELKMVAGTMTPAEAAEAYASTLDDRPDR